MIPVRIAADKRPILATDRLFKIDRDHPMAPVLCPVCDQPLCLNPGPDGYALKTDELPEVVLVFVGIAKEDRKDSGWTTGAAVGVHKECAM